MTLLATRDTALADRTDATNRFLFCLTVLGLSNALYTRVAFEVVAFGWTASLMSTFRISAIVWLAIWLVVDLLRKTDFGALSRLDVAVMAVFSLALVPPVTGLSWVALSALSVYMLLTRRNNESVRRPFWVLLALTFSMFWSPMIFRFYMGLILRVDTLVVAAMTGADSRGNLIQAADGRTTLQVLEGCTSFNNMSLAFLGWIVARSWFGTRGLQRSVFFVGLSCLAVIAINTIRIGIIVLRPDLYEIAHGDVGSNIANLATAAAIASISYYGARR